MKTNRRSLRFGNIKLCFWPELVCSSTGLNLMKLKIFQHSGEGLTLETSALEFLYVGQFILSAQLIKSNYLATPPNDAAPHFV